MRTCTNCRAEKALEEFSRKKNGKYGRASQCKQCAKEYAAAWYVENKDHAAKLRKAWYRSNKDRVAEYYAANRDRIAERARERYAANRDEILDRNAEYRAANPHLHWESTHRRRSASFGFDPIVESFTKEALLAEYGDSCWHCGGPFEEIDHFPIPVSKGGPHTLENCRPACRKCNKRSWTDRFTSRATGVA